MPRLGEWTPGDVEPTIAGEQLVGELVGLLHGYFCVLMNSSNVKCLLSFVCSMIVAFNDFDVLVEPEDATSQQERLRHVIEQSAGDVLDADYLIGYERDTDRKSVV